MRPSAEERCCPPPKELPELRHYEDEAADQELALLAKALGHPARVKILRMLARQQSCICGDFVEEFALAQSTVSQHLRVLKEAGLIRGETEGPRSCYCLEPNTLRRLRALVALI